MKNLTEVKFDLPIYWATYLMYDDESGLEDGEKEIIDEILEDLELNFCTCVDVLDNQYLELCPPSYMPSGMGGDYCTYVFLQYSKDPHPHSEDLRECDIDNSNNNNQLELFTLNF